MQIAGFGNVSVKSLSDWVRRIGGLGGGCAEWAEFGSVLGG
jgi:hypothetical protein